MRSPLFRLFFALIAFAIPGMALGQQFWRTDGTSGTWITGTNWSATPTLTGGSAWVSGSNVVFTADSASTFATTTVGNVTVADGVTVTVSQDGTLSTGGAARTYNVGTGSALIWTTQDVSAAASQAGFIKDGAGTWNIGAQGNAYNATNFGFTLNQGTVIVSGNSSFGGANSLLTINGGTIQSSGTRAFANNIVLGGNHEQTGTGNATFSGTVALGSATRTITNNTTSGSRIFSGEISGSAGVGLIFAGSGVTTLSGANTYTGTTTVNAGTLNVTGNTAAGSVVTVNGGSLTGTGTVGGPVTVAIGGTIEAGNVGIGTLTINNVVTVQSGGTLRAQAGVGAGTADSLNLSGGTGTLTIASGSNLTIVGDGTAYTGSPTYTLATLGSGGGTFGTFSGTGDIASYSANGTYTSSGVNVNLSGFTFNSGEQLTLRRTANTLELVFTPVPEPASMLAVCGLVVGGFVAVRKLRRKGKPADVTPAA